jgi:hypothetical protein
MLPGEIAKTSGEGHDHIQNNELRKEASESRNGLVLLNCRNLT